MSGFKDITRTPRVRAGKDKSNSLGKEKKEDRKDNRRRKS
jgi:hypothetical protein